MPTKAPFDVINGRFSPFIRPYSIGPSPSLFLVSDASRKLIFCLLSFQVLLPSLKRDLASVLSSRALLSRLDQRFGFAAWALYV